MPCQFRRDFDGHERLSNVVSPVKMKDFKSYHHSYHEVIHEFHSLYCLLIHDVNFMKLMQWAVDAIVAEQ